jgi:hypothetical protein
MEQQQKQKIVKWAKRVVGLSAFILWGFAIYHISQLDTTFKEQAPYCMGTTMLIFMLLSGVFKALEYFEKH